MSADLKPIGLYTRLGYMLYEGPPAGQISHPVIRATVEDHARAEVERDAAYADVEKLREQLEVAQAEDSAALVDALDRGAKRRPEATRTARAKADLEDAEGLAEAHDRLVTQRLRTLAQAMSDHQEAWAAETHREAESKRMEFVTALSTAIEKFGAYEAATKIDRYAHGGCNRADRGVSDTVRLAGRQTVSLMEAMQAGRSLGVVERKEPAYANGINPAHLASGEL